MTELSRDARSLVARARVHEGPSAEARARIRAKLEPAWAASAEQPSAASIGGLRTLLRRVPIANAIVVLAVAGWSPSQPSAAGERAPLTAADRVPPPTAAITTTGAHAAASQPAKQSTRRPVAPGAAPLAARTPERSQLSAAAARVRAFGQLGMARRSASDHSHGRARDLQPVEAAPAGGPDQDARALRPSLDSKRPLAMTDARATGSTGRTASGTEVARSLPSATNRARSSAVTLQNQTAPVQTRTEFKPQAIDDELAWIGAAQEALQNHKPSLALRLVEQHSFRFPDGALTQERLVVHTLALCALERFTAARRMLEVLVERAPDAPIVARVRSNCGL